MIKRTYDDFIENNEFNASFFEEASKAWRSNKVERENGTFEYKKKFRGFSFEENQNCKCMYVKRRGRKVTPCTRVIYEYELIAKKKPLLPNCDILCKAHIYKEINPKVK